MPEISLIWTFDGRRPKTLSDSEGREWMKIKPIIVSNANLEVILLFFFHGNHMYGNKFICLS